jgi:PhnB protein
MTVKQGRGVQVTIPVPTGSHSVTPRIVVEDAAALVEFLRRVFEATAEFRTDGPSQIRIGDSVLMVSTPGAHEIFPAFLHVYVEDADARRRKNGPVM